MWPHPPRRRRLFCHTQHESQGLIGKPHDSIETAFA
jgi:hypothetical protein